MKRSIAFLLAMIMIIGVVPMTVLPVLSHGIGVAVNGVQNLSIDNAPNQKIPATVELDGLSNDTAWKSDEWQNADAQYGIWNAATVNNPNFEYRYQLHMDYEFLYGVIEYDMSDITSGELDNFTVWLNDGSNSSHYTAKVELKYDDGFGIGVYRYGSSSPVATFAQYTYEFALVKETDNGDVKTIEFKALISDILGMQFTTETEVNLSSFVSAKIGTQYLYHPRVDAHYDMTGINPANAWPTNSLKVTQSDLYATYADANAAGKNYTDSAVDHVDSVDLMDIDGVLNEEAWTKFTSYGGSGFDTLKEYQQYGDGYKLPSYDVEYSTIYQAWKADPLTASNTDFVHFHENNINYQFSETGSNGDVEFTEGCYSGYTPAHNSAIPAHTCSGMCNYNYIKNIPVKFKYQIKSDGTNIYGAMVVSLNTENTDFYFDKSKGYDTYFKVMFDDNRSSSTDSGEPAKQLELKHNLKNDNSVYAYSDASVNTRTIGDNSHFKTNKANVFADGVAAYAKRVDKFTMVFEFCVSYAALNKETDSSYFAPNKEINIILSVSNKSTPVSTVGAGASNAYSVKNGVVAASAPYFVHGGVYDPLGRENVHRYKFDGSDPEFSASNVNGTLEAGIFNGLIATDRFINAAYRPSIGTSSKSKDTKNQYGNWNTPSPGATLWMDYSLFMSSEYLYGAAIVKKNGYELASTVNGIACGEFNSHDVAFDSNDHIKFWINNGTPQAKDSYDYYVQILLKSGELTIVGSDQTDTGAADGGSMRSDYQAGASSVSNYTSGINYDRGYETYFVDQTGVQVSKKKLTNEMLTNSSTGTKGTLDGEVAVVEFKIPLELLGISEKYAETPAGINDDIAMSYFVSAETNASNSEGIVSPIPDNRPLDFDGNGAKLYVDDKIFLTQFGWKEGSTLQGALSCTSISGVNGANFLKSNHRTNQFVIDGVLDETIWNDAEERVVVNSTKGSWGDIPETSDMFDYSYKIYVGRENLYGMAQINTAANNNEELDFTLWIKDTSSATKATDKFRIVRKGDKAYCYGLNGKEFALTYDVKRYEQNRVDTYTATTYNGKVAMTVANGITYVEFMFSLEGCGIVTHANGETAWIQYRGGVDGTPHSSYAPNGDKFFVNVSGSTYTENKKNGFEYFVSVTKTDTALNKNTTLYYPANKVTGNTVNSSDKFAHLADESGYNGEDRWDASNAHVVAPIGYFVPETITIDGKLDDNGWDDSKWIEVQAGANGNLQNAVEDLMATTETSYKFQLRMDEEYVYVAMVLDVPCSPKRYTVDCECSDHKNSSEDSIYSIPVMKFWIQSQDEQYSVDIKHNELGQKKYTYDDAVSFTHLHEVKLSTSSTNGTAIPNTIGVEKEQYVPDSYVTWQDNNVKHYTEDEHVSVNFSGTTGQLITNGTFLRFASNDMGFFAPHGGTARSSNDKVAVLQYKIGDGAWVNNKVGSNYPTVAEKDKYGDSAIYGSTKVIEENSVTARHPDGSAEKEYIDKDWYAKPEIKGYVYGNEHGIMTSDETGMKTVVEYKFALSEIGCEDGDDFEYIIQGGTTGIHDYKGYTLFYPPITYSFSKTTNYDAQKSAGRPYWYWASNAAVVDANAKEEMKLRNNYEPVTPIGTQYYDNYPYENGTFLAMKFGMFYDADYIRQPANHSTDIYKNATYWDVKEIGMLVGYTDSLLGDAYNLTLDNVDDYNIYNLQSDMILNHVEGTNAADYENYIFYAIQLLWPEEYDTKLTYRGYVEYYPEDQIYYDMADKVFGTFTYTTSESTGSYYGKPLELGGKGNTDPTKIPGEYTYRPTFYSDPVTRNANMIRFASDKMKGETNLPGNSEDMGGTIPDINGVPVVYVPIDNRPVNLERVQHQAASAGFELIIPPETAISAMLEGEAEGKSDQGNPRELYEWLYDCFYNEGYMYYIISVDQMLSGGLVGSREPFDDTDDTIANQSSLANFVPGGNAYNGQQGYTLSTEEIQIIDLLKEIAESPTTYTIYFDTVKRLASTYNYFDWDMDDYNELRAYGGIAPEQLYGSELTIENIVKSYTEDENGNALTIDITADKYKKFIAARERKLRIADALYPTLAEYADTFYVGYDDSKPHVTMQTNDGRYIEEKLINGSDNTYIFSGADELGMMGMTKIVTHLYGSVSANVEFIGIGKDFPGDDYDTGTLYTSVMYHINGIGATYSADNKGEVDILILTRADESSLNDSAYTSAELTNLTNYAGQLIDRVAENLKNNRPTIVIDSSYKDGYLATMMMQRYATDTHTNDISEQLNELLAYSHWGTTANSVGIAISQGISRYSYLKNSSKVTEESHMAAIKATVRSWIKDYAYRTGDISGSLTSDHPYNGQAEFSKEYNNFFELTGYIMEKLNASPCLVGIDEDGKIVTAKDYQATVSNLNWGWDRYHEVNFDINVVSANGFTAPDYSDYKVTNLALDKNYSTSWKWSSNYEDYNDGELTNGVRVYQGDYYDPYWAGWNFDNGNGAEYFDVTIDLGAKYPVYQINLDILSMGLKAGSTTESSGGVYTPSKIQLLTSNSESGTYTLQRTLTLEPKTTQSITKYYLGTNGEAVEAQYVKVRIYRNTDVASHWIFCSEIEVLGIDGSRAEYVDSTGLYFNYKAADNETPYVVFKNYGDVNYSETDYMTVDDGQRLVIYHNSDKNTYTPNMIYSNNIFGNWSRTIQSGWWLKDANGNKVADGTAGGSNSFILEMDGDFMLTQIAVHTASKLSGISTPTYAKLYIIDANGTETLVPTNLYQLAIYDGNTDSDADYESLEGIRWVLEVADDPLYFPQAAKLRVEVGRTSDTGAEAFIYTGIQVIGRFADNYINPGK